MSEYIKSKAGVYMDKKKASEKMAKQLNLVRQKKIAKLRSKIGSGHYHIANNLIARSLFYSG